MYAVIKSGGRQYKVAVGERLEVNRLFVEVGDQVRFEEVLMISDAENIMVGTPLVGEAMVLATATEQGRGEKLIVFKYKSKKRYRHRRGHRQELTFLTIDDIVANGKSLITGEAPTLREAGVLATDDVETDETDTDETTSTENEAAEPEVEKKSRRRRTVKAEEQETEAEE